MAVPPRRFEVIREQSVLDDGGQDRGNSKNTAAATGRYNAESQVVRDLMLIPFESELGTDVYQITGARLWVYGQGEAIFAGTTLDGLPSGTAPKIRLRALAADFNSGGGTEDVWSLIANANWATQPALDTDSPPVERSIATGIGARSLDVAALVEYHAPARILNRAGTACGGATNHGWRLSSPNESAVVNNAIFGTIRHTLADRRPYLEIDVETNSPPDAPEVLSPVPTSSRDSAPRIVPSNSGRELVVVFNFSDAEGDPVGKAQLQVLPDGATDTVPGTPIANTGLVAIGAGLTKLSEASQYSIRVANLPKPHEGTHGPWRFRVRAQDPKGATGPWTSVDAGHIQTAYIVGVPLLPSMQTRPDRPLIYGTLNSPDPGDYLTGWRGEFYRDTAEGAVELWAPGTLAAGGTRSAIPYAGRSLNDGDVVRWRQRHINRDGVEGKWSPFQQTTIKLAGGPTFIPADTGTKLTSRTAAVDIVFGESSDGYHWWLYRSGVLIHDSGEVSIVAAASVTVNLPTGKVGWGDTLEIEAQSRADGSDDFGTLSGRSGLYVNALPGTVTTAGDGEVTGVPVVGTTDVVWSSPVTDPDDTVETIAAKELELRVAASPPGSGALIAGGRRTHTTGIVEDEHTEPDSSVAAETSMDGRARYYDGADPKAELTLAANAAIGATNIKYAAPTVGAIAVGDEVTLTGTDYETRTVTVVGTSGAGGTGLDLSEACEFAHASASDAYVWPWGQWSDWATVKASADPVVAAVSPADGSLTEDPRPELVHSYASIKAAAYRTLHLYERDPTGGDTLIWEKDVTGEGLTDTIPAFLLVSDRTYAWQKTVYDTDGLFGETELRTFSTAFNVPLPVIDLVATADPITSGITLAWTLDTDALVSTLDPPEVVTSDGEDVTVNASPIIDHYRVYWVNLAGIPVRIDLGPAAFEDGRTPLEEPTFTYYGGRLGTNTFRVTAHNGALESDPVAVSVDLLSARGGMSMVATDGLARYTFPVGLDSAPRTRSPQIDVFRVPGGRTVHQVWGAGGRHVSVRFTYIPSEDGDLVTPLHELLDAGTPTWLKLTEPYKFDVMRVLLVDLRDEPVRNGLTTVQLDLDETSWS